METINTIELQDENVYPSEKVLRPILGNSYELYVMLLELFQKNDMSYEWCVTHRHHFNR